MLNLKDHFARLIRCFEIISVQSGNTHNHSRGALHLGGSVGLKSNIVSVSCHPANFELSTPLNRFSITYSHNTFPSVQDILTPLHSTASSFSNKEIYFKIHHTSINPSPSLPQTPIPKSPRAYEFMSIENLKTFGQYHFKSFWRKLQHYQLCSRGILVQNGTSHIFSVSVTLSSL